MKPNALIFDLDDTLIDTRKRHYQIVIDFLTISGITINLSFNEYINIRKDNNFTNLQLLKHKYPTERLENKFNAFWKENIESSSYLKLDELIADYDMLKKSSITNDLYILSLRSNHFNAINQVKSFPFYSLFHNVFFLSHQKDNNPKTNELLRLKKLYNEIKFIGDSESDIEAAFNASVNIILVKTGIYGIKNEINRVDINDYLRQI